MQYQNFRRFKMGYTIEDFEEDQMWLIENGIETIERVEFVKWIIKKSFSMTREEYVTLMDKLQEKGY